MRSTVSSPEKGRPATAAGAHHVLDYREGDPAAEIREFAPDGVDIVAEVALGTNLALDLAVLRTRGTISAYANDAGKPVELDMPQSMVLNARLQFLVLYTAGPEALAVAVACETRNTFWYEPGIRQLITADGKRPGSMTWAFVMERVTRIELALSGPARPAVDRVFRSYGHAAGTASKTVGSPATCTNPRSI